MRLVCLWLCTHGEIKKKKKNIFGIINPSFTNEKSNTGTNILEKTKMIIKIKYFLFVWSVWGLWDGNSNLIVNISVKVPFFCNFGNIFMELSIHTISTLGTSPSFFPSPTPLLQSVFRCCWVKMAALLENSLFSVQSWIMIHATDYELW